MVAVVFRPHRRPLNRAQAVSCGKKRPITCLCFLYSILYMRTVVGRLHCTVCNLSFFLDYYCRSSWKHTRPARNASTWGSPFFIPQSLNSSPNTLFVIHLSLGEIPCRTAYSVRPTGFILLACLGWLSRNKTNLSRRPERCAATAMSKSSKVGKEHSTLYSNLIPIASIDA